MRRPPETPPPDEATRQIVRHIDPRNTPGPPAGCVRPTTTTVECYEYHCRIARHVLFCATSKSDQRPAALVEALPLDPWGQPYDYAHPGERGEFDIVSFGRDGVLGGEGEDADIGSWALGKR